MHPTTSPTHAESSHLWPALSAALVAAMMLGFSAQVQAQEAEDEEDAIEEIVVTGSLIKGTPADAASPVSVIDRSDLEDLGDPTLVELIRNLGVASGNLGETNQFQVNSGEGLATINLRGLGPNRTLVLLNGGRLSYAAFGDADLVDINNIPNLAIERIEILKEGAAVTYGSDAVAGVANFITRSDFEGFEISTTVQMIADSGDDFSLGAIWGGQVGPGNLVVSFSQRDRGELKARDRDWHTGYVNLGSGVGWSSVGNPGTLVGVAAGVGADGAPREVATVFLADPGCSPLGGGLPPNPNTGSDDEDLQKIPYINNRCFYRYSTFDNIKEEENYTHLFAEYNADIGPGELHVDFLDSSSEVPQWATSPSYPPQELVGGTREIPATHPGLLQYRKDHPDLFTAWEKVVDAAAAKILSDEADRDDEDKKGIVGAGRGPIYFWGRTVGSTGLPDTASGAELGTRGYDVFRLNTDYQWSSGDSSHFVGFTQGSNSHNRTGWDGYIDRTYLAFNGFGGANCAAEVGVDEGGDFIVVENGAVAGEGGCQWYNPFSNGIEFSKQFGAQHVEGGTPNPDYDPALANSPELLRWMFGQYSVDIDTSLTVMQYRYQKDNLFSLGDSSAALAAGIDIRSADHDVAVNDEYNLNINPCPNPVQKVSVVAGDGGCESPTGRFGFLTGTYPSSASTDVTAFYGELALPFSDRFDMQAALRYEDYGDSDTFDPKFAVRFSPMDQVTLRGSYSTSFRAPAASQILPDGRSTVLAFVGAALAFKAVDVLTNPDLQPESATTTNFGIVYDNEDSGIFASADLWSFDFQDPIAREGENAIVGAYSAGGASKAAIQDRIVCPGGVRDGSCSAADVTRIETYYVNGPSIQTSGIDLFFEWSKALSNFDLDLGLEHNIISTYDVDSYLINGAVIETSYDAVGDLNRSQSAATPLPGSKTRLWARLGRGNWVANVQMNLVPSYEDRRDATATIDAMQTIDANFSYDFSSVSTALETATAYIVISNLADTDPPNANLDLAYDPFTHSPFGQIIKLGMRLGF